MKLSKEVTGKEHIDDMTSQERKKLIFTPEGFTHFGNSLAKLIMEFAIRRPDGVKNILTFDDSKYEGK